jgi:hypothetical protein
MAFKKNGVSVSLGPIQAPKPVEAVPVSPPADAEKVDSAAEKAAPKGK